MDYFDIPLTEDMQGKAIFDFIEDDKEIRKASLYGVMGGQVNVTDGQYVYMRATTTEDNKPLYDYTLMPTHMKNRFSPRELQEWEKVEGFGFMKGCKVMQIPTRSFPIWVLRLISFIPELRELIEALIRSISKLGSSVYKFNNFLFFSNSDMATIGQHFNMSRCYLNI